MGASFQFSNAYVSTPLCCPSRASFLTGLYQHNTGVKNNNCYVGGFHEGPEKRSLGVALQAAGYKTFYAGKYLNTFCKAGPCDVPPGWDYFAGLHGNSV